MIEHSLFSQSYQSHDLFEFSSDDRHKEMWISGKVPIPNEQKFNQIRNPAVEIRHNNLLLLREQLHEFVDEHL